MNIYLLWALTALWIIVSLATAFALGRIIDMRNRRG